MGDLRNKARKEAQTQAARQAEELRRNGYTVFHFDFRPQQTCRNLGLGDAFRQLKHLTGYKVRFWKCPVRGLAMEFHSPHGLTYRLMHFSTNENEEAAKRELALNALLNGIELYRGLPNAVFDQQVAIIKWLLTAPPSVDKEEWLKAKAMLHPQTPAAAKYPPGGPALPPPGRPLPRTHRAGGLRGHAAHYVSHVIIVYIINDIQCSILDFKE